jgi:glycerol-3-phosphate dehydrogenase
LGQTGQTGLISLISVRYTVARRDAVEAIDLASKQLDGRHSERDSTSSPLPGGDIQDFNAAAAAFEASRPHWLAASAAQGMFRNYGTEAARVIELAQLEPHLARCFSGSHVSFAEAIHAVRKEMAQRMTDVVFRRTELGTDGHPGKAALDELQTLLATELGWSDTRQRDERARVESELRRFLAEPSNRTQQNTNRECAFS